MNAGKTWEESGEINVAKTMEESGEDNQERLGRNWMKIYVEKGRIRGNKYRKDWGSIQTQIDGKFETTI